MQIESISFKYIIIAEEALQNRAIIGKKDARKGND